MNCVKVRNLLSEYLDGEIQGTDREIIEEHLAECDSCARVSAVLQSTSRLLCEVGEVEPPAGLLAQIEAATINRPTLGQKARTALEQLTRVPASARWAMASATAAVALAFVMMSHPGTHQIATAPVHSPQSPSVTAAQPAASPAVTPASKPAPVVVAETKAVPASQPTRAQRRHMIALAKTVTHRRPAVKAPVHTAVAKVAPKVTPIPVAEESATSDVTANQNVPAAAPAPETEQEIKIVRASVAPQADWQKKEADSLAELRAKLAARNKQRRYEVQPETLDGRKVSIDLASIRF
jgi:anti-sigma factor RsiW